MDFYLLRNIYTPKTTIGDLITDHRLFCHTLEDVVRASNAPKIPGQTAIPAGRYQVVLTMSQRFKRIMPCIMPVPGFVGVRMHGGNTSENTEGCIITAKYIINKDTVQGTMEAELTKLLSERSETHYIEIINTYPYVGTN